MPTGTSTYPLETWPAAVTPANAPSGTAWGAYGTRTTAALAGLLTPFTVSLVGEMPIGEFFLMGVIAYLTINALLSGRWPGEIFRQRQFWVLCGSQVLAWAAYIFSDFYRDSSAHDMARGWGRMLFLELDLVAMSYLLVSDRLSFFYYLFAELAGEVARAVLVGSLFGDIWKFGIGVPLTYFVIAGACLVGPWTAIAASAGMGCVSLVLDFRSFGAICFLVAALTGLQQFGRRLRPMLIPLVVLTMIVSYAFYRQSQANNVHRATRSDVSRSSMLIVTSEAFLHSPLIGQGSWFSNSDVWEDFLVIRKERAREAHVGGFPEENEGPGTVAFHSQLLVALAEGGIFGASFFFTFGFLLVRTLYELCFTRPWERAGPVFLLLLLSSLCNLFFSPFSGAHRVYIAASCGLVFLIRKGWDDIDRRRISP